METSKVWVDGIAHEPGRPAVRADDPGFLTGWTVFETVLVFDGRLVSGEEHLRRLAGSADAACIPCESPIVAAELRSAARDLSGLWRLRITLSGSGIRVMQASPVDPSRRGGPIRAVTGPWRADPWLDGAVKHGSRAPWVVAVRRSGVDEVLLVDDAGRFMEGTTSAILAVVSGVIRVMPEDGRVLSSTALGSHLDAAESRGLAVLREPASVRDRLDALYILSATRRLCPVILLNGAVLPGWDPIGRALADADDQRWGFHPMQRP